ncbi:phosphotransferase, partial [Pseudomonas aeruginosa]|uniref:phosphotransferase n=1 Tax=Pseudomonas aeruginosa TaxID=287 RepID=UPI003BA9853E
MPAFEWVHVQLHQQKGMISLSPPTICNSAVCHGDPCMPNFMVDPKTLQCTGLIDLGRLGTADRYADLALMIANAEENWAAPDEAERAFAVLFNVLGIEAPDRERLAFYLRLDPLTWG